MSKIVSAIKEHRLKSTISKKLKSYLPLYYVKDPCVAEDIEREKVARKLYSKYSYVFEKKYTVKKCPKTPIVWMLWLQGEKEAPEIVKACISSARSAFSDYECVVLDSRNIEKYVNLPSYIKEKYQKGLISNAHFSDIVRTALLAERGGVWLDATVFCSDVKIPSYIKDAQLFVFKDIKLPLYRQNIIAASNWLIVAKKNDPIIMTTYDLLKEYWKNELTTQDYFFYHLFFKMSTDCYADEWGQVPSFSNVPPHIMQSELGKKFKKERWDQICSMSIFHKLSHHIEYDKDGTFFGYIIKSNK